MKTRREKRSEAFWPSIVMKKWFNIKPKAYEFSEDELGSETESDDDNNSVKDEYVQDHVENLGGRRQGNLAIYSSQTSGMHSKACNRSRHKRGKSETLRVQYINTKDVRVTIGTWNVAGRSPHSDLEIGEWLYTKEPSDIYILGFQEVVPLNAANVLGAETRRPIAKWESIIRKTLNKSFEPEPKHKSYSAPPSPVHSASSSMADILESPLEIVAGQSILPNYKVDPHNKKSDTQTGTGQNMHLRPKDLDLDWPERSLDSSSNSLPTFKLRRVSSSSKLMGNSVILSLDDSTGLKRVPYSLGNLVGYGLDQEYSHEVLEDLSDISDSVYEKEDDSFDEISDMQDENPVLSYANKKRAKYVRIVSKQMVGVYVSVWVRRRLRRYVNNLKVSPVGVGLMGYMGNKGSVSVSMSVYQTRLCFVCCHLTSGGKEGDEQRRNADVYEILKRTCFSSDFDEDQPLAVRSHDQIFWFGDLNYRIDMSDTEVRKLAAQKQWDELLKFDQLMRELQRGRVFEGWNEGIINFAPTYKYEINSDRYVGENPKDGEKKRSPAWCDRILWLGKGIRQVLYTRSESQMSDHRPVTSVFSVEVEILNRRKLQRALNAASATVHPELYID